MATITENKRKITDKLLMAKIVKRVVKYSLVLLRRIYRPVKPLANPLLKKLKLSYVLGGLIIVGIGGSFWFNGNRYLAQERAAWWPWSTTAHSQMALAWLENGNEEKAIEELKLANKLLIIKTLKAEEALKKAEEAVSSPGKIRLEIESWEKILQERPSYVDILLRLSLLNYQIYENEKAKSFWGKADYLDPNNAEVQKVGKIIFSLP